MIKKRLSIAIPASIVSDIPHLREKTSRVGLIGRTAAIFRVSEIIIYLDNPNVDQTREASLVVTLLNYMETPQYLRKSLFKLKPELRYAGVLPPLRTPHHPINREVKKLRIGEYREGVTLSKTREGTFVDIGVERLALLPNRQLPLDNRITVKIKAIGKNVEVEEANVEEITEYWGYKVQKRENLGKILKDFDLTIATSKYGVSFMQIRDKIAESWAKAKTILLAFGAPTRGLYEILEKEGFNLDEVADFVVNMVPNQGTETVRTEEALIASLAVLNVHFLNIAVR